MEIDMQFKVFVVQHGTVIVDASDEDTARKEALSSEASPLSAVYWYEPIILSSEPLEAAYNE